MLWCCARRRDGALERLRGDVIDLPYKPPQHNETIDVFYIKKNCAQSWLYLQDQTVVENWKSFPAVFQIHQTKIITNK